MTQEAIPIHIAAKQIALSETVLRNRIKSGAIEGYKMGRDWFIPIAEVERLAKEYPLPE